MGPWFAPRTTFDRMLLSGGWTSEIAVRGARGGPGCGVCPAGAATVRPRSRIPKAARVEIGDGEIRHLEALAALRLEDAARERIRGHLQRILEYVGQLEAIDVEGVPPTYHVIESSNVLRADEVQPSLANDVVLGNAPDARDGFYRVPRFVGEAEGPA